MRACMNPAVHITFGAETCMQHCSVCLQRQLTDALPHGEKGGGQAASGNLEVITATLSARDPARPIPLFESLRYPARPVTGPIYRRRRHRGAPPATVTLGEWWSGRPATTRMAKHFLKISLCNT